MAGGDSDDALICCVDNTVKDHIMDSGASFHATYCKKELERFKLRFGKVRLADDKTLDIVDVEDVVLKTSFGTSWTLKDVRIGMSMLASKGNIPDVRKVDINFSKPGLRIPKEKWRGKDTSLTHLKETAQTKCDTDFRIRRVTKLFEAEVDSNYKARAKVGAQIRVRGSKIVGASRIVEDQMKNTLKTEHLTRMEAPRLHMYEDPPESPGLQ
nr:retrovirus-related Pol polyprotein from transposon TNT 1-94 [Tanacetum cinerariifolium]